MNDLQSIESECYAVLEVVLGVHVLDNMSTILIEKLELGEG